MGARGTRSLYDYDDVAFTCRVAHTRGESMVLAVEVEFDVSTIVARGLINRARRAGYSIPHVRPDKVQTDFDGYEPVSLDLFTPEPWQADAECRDLPPDLFFPSSGPGTEAAKAVCATCPVCADCLDAALRRVEQHGVWGGTTPRERRRMRRGLAVA